MIDGLAISAAFVSFIVTNLDDFLILIVFFAQINDQKRGTNTAVAITQSASAAADEVLPHPASSPTAQADPEPAAEPAEPAAATAAATNGGDVELAVRPESAPASDDAAPPATDAPAPVVPSAVWHVVLGQYVGFTVIVGLSLIGLVADVLFPTAYVGLVGIVPCLIGAQKLYKVIRYGPDDGDDDDGDDSDKAKDGANGDDAALTVTAAGRCTTCWRATVRVVRAVLSHRVFQVAALTVANGGDNIGIYLPLFATAGGQTDIIIVTLIVWYILVAVWCGVSYGLVRCPAIAKLISKYGSYIVPIALIGIGLYVMYSAGTFQI